MGYTHRYHEKPRWGYGASGPTLNNKLTKQHLTFNIKHLTLNNYETDI